MNLRNFFGSVFKITIVCNAITNLIFAIQNKENRKVFISHLTLMIILVILAILNVIDAGNIINIIICCAYVIAFIMQSVVLKSLDYIQESKLNNILTGVLAFLAVILSVTAIMSYVPKYARIIERVNYKTKIENAITNTFEEYTGQNYTMIKRQGKIGYTSQGQQKIPCIYTQADNMEGFENIFINGKRYPITIVKEGENYKILSTNGNTVDLGENPVNFDGWKGFEVTYRIYILLMDRLESGI